MRLFTVALFYSGQGIPLGPFDFANPAWIADSGAKAAHFGFRVARALNMTVGVQDVAADALTVDVLQEKKRAIGGALSLEGQELGIAASPS